MEDTSIIELFWARSEDAIIHAQIKYGGYCRSIAFSILHSHEDAEECENDTFLHAWRSIPPHKPSLLSAFLGKIARNLSIDRLRRKNTQKRGGEYALVLEETENWLVSIEDPGSPEDELDAEILASYINDFLDTVSKKARLLFIGRYWNMLSVAELSDKFGLSESAVKTSLHRTRNELAKYLIKEGYTL